jgi:hypothetical protein
MSYDDVSEFVENILIILSNLPPGLRLPIIKKRLNEFNSFDVTDQKEIINNILNNYHKIERSAILNLFDSWLNSLSEMESHAIVLILYSYLLELYLNSDILKKFDSHFISSLSSQLNKLPENKRFKLWNCFMESILNTPNPMDFIKLIPVSLKE